MKIIIKDNFISHPENIRQIALRANLEAAWDSDGDFYDYVETKVAMDVDKVNQQFSRIAGENIYLMNSKFYTFNYYFKGAGVPTYVHHDDCDYIAIIYLSLSYQPEDGLSLYTHKPSGSQHHTELFLGNSLGSDMEANKSNYDLSLWEKYMFVHAKYNRLVFFEPLYYHAASPGFGENVEECRLAQVMYFVKENSPYFDEACIVS